MKKKRTNKRAGRDNSRNAFRFEKYVLVPEESVVLANKSMLAILESLKCAMYAYQGSANITSR